VNFKDNSSPSLTTGFEHVMAARKPNAKALSEEIDQFVVKFIDDELACEKLIRLENGFPTTAREKAIFDARQEKNIQAFMKVFCL
jgi:hypothetical protein